MNLKIFFIFLIVENVCFKTVIPKTVKQIKADPEEGICHSKKDCAHIKGSRCMDTLPYKTCSCPENTIMNAEETECLPRITKLGDKCRFTSQCISGLFGAFCSADFKCECMSNFHFSKVFRQCIPSKKFGDTCVEKNDLCYEATDDGNVNSLNCVGGICKCKEDFKRLDNKCIQNNQNPSGPPSKSGSSWSQYAWGLIN